MILKEQIDLISRIDFFISHGATGPPDEFAKKLNISRRKLFKYLELLKEDFSAPISYSSLRQSYTYKKEVQFKFGLKKKS